MHCSTIIATALFGASITMAFPAFKRTVLCPGIEDTPQCCAVNALGVADLNCAPRMSRSPFYSPLSVPNPNHIFHLSPRRR